MIPKHRLLRAIHLLASVLTIGWTVMVWGIFLSGEPKTLAVLIAVGWASVGLIGCVSAWPFIWAYREE